MFTWVGSVDSSYCAQPQQSGASPGNMVVASQALPAPVPDTNLVRTCHERAVALSRILMASCDTSASGGSMSVTRTTSRQRVYNAQIRAIPGPALVDGLR